MEWTIERRDGRVTMHEYRAVVTVNGQRAVGSWQYARKTAVADVRLLRASLFDPDKAEARLVAESQRRCRATRTAIETDRRISFP